MHACCMPHNTATNTPWPSGPQQTKLYGQVAHCNMSLGTGPPQPLLNFGPAAHSLKYRKLIYKSHMGPHRVCMENSANLP